MTHARADHGSSPTVSRSPRPPSLLPLLLLLLLVSDLSANAADEAVMSAYGGGGPGSTGGADTEMTGVEGISPRGASFTSQVVMTVSLVSFASHLAGQKGVRPGFNMITVFLVHRHKSKRSNLSNVYSPIFRTGCC